MDEHFSPTEGLDLDAYVARGDDRGAHHLLRYLWALECVRDRPHLSSLLDLGCGAGYGTFLLASRFPHAHVVGVDADPDAVAEAAASYRLPNLEIRHGDATRWNETIGPALYDCVVSFDAIEHVAHRELFLEGVVDHLLDDGRLLLSTPCAWDANVLTPDWPYHKIEYSKATLYDLLSRYFGDLARPDDGSLPHLPVFDRLKGSGVEYLLEMNPVACERPIRVANPYKPTRTESIAREAFATRVHPIAGDWTGGGADLPGLFDSATGRVTLALPGGESLAFDFGVRGGVWRPVAGDWDGDGVDTVGAFNALTGVVLLKRENASGGGFATSYAGVEGAEWAPVAGDWGGDGLDAIGVFNTRTREWRVGPPGREHATAEPLRFGPDGDDLVPVAGDWTGAGCDSVGVCVPTESTFFLKSSSEMGEADFCVVFGDAGDVPLVGDWDGDGVDTIAVYRARDRTFYLRASNTAGPADAAVTL